MQDYLGTALSGVSLGVAALDRSGAILQANEAFIRLFGLEAAPHVEGRSLIAELPDADRAGFGAQLEDIVSHTRGAFSEERQFLRHARQWWGHVTLWAHGSEDAAILLVKDISDRRLLQEAHNQILRMLAQGSEDREVLRAICRMGERHLANAVFCIATVDDGRFGIAAATRLPQAMLQFIEGMPVREGQSAAATACVRNEPVLVTDVSIDPCCAGIRGYLMREGIVSAWATPIRNPEGEILGAMVICSAIPFQGEPGGQEPREACLHLADLVLERRRQRGRRRDAEQLTQAILENSSDCVKLLSTSGEVEYMNGPGMRMIEVERFDQIAGRKWQEFWQPQDQERATAALQAGLRGETGRFQGICPTATGIDRWWDVMITAIPAADGRPRRLLSISRDITDLKRSEEALRASEERFRLLADNMNQFAWMADANGWIFWYNQRWYDYTGTTLEVMQGWGWRQVHHPEHVDRVVRRWSACLAAATEPWEDTFPLRGRDGQYRWFLSRAMPVRDAAGKVVLWFGTNTDISVLRDRDATLRRSNEDLQQFAYMASHDLQEPLRTMSLFAQLALREGADGPAAGHLNRIVEASKRMASLIADLLAYAETSACADESRQLVNLAELAGGVLERAGARGAQFEARVPHLPAVLGNQTALTQVFDNLVSNAWKYRRPDVPLRIDITCDPHEDGWRIGVCDNGQGFEPEHAAHIFGIFRRLHGQEVPGTGVGLAIVKSVVERHGGRVWAEASPGAGCSVFLTLPRAPEPDIGRSALQNEPVTTARQ